MSTTMIHGSVMSDVNEVLLQAGTTAHRSLPSRSTKPEVPVEQAGEHGAGNYSDGQPASPVPHRRRLAESPAPSLLLRVFAP
jgi:hypothetical protein